MKIRVLILLVCGLAVWGEPALLRHPAMLQPPRIDGRFTPEEWRDAAGCYGTLRLGGSWLSRRQVRFYLAYDAENLYFACLSELPPEPLQLIARVHEQGGKVFLDDAVELLLQPPSGEHVYQLIMNANGCALGLRYPVRHGGVSHEIYQSWQPAFELASGRAEDGWWVLEARLPLAELGVTALPWGEAWRLQMVRDWRQPDEQTPWNPSRMFCDPAQMGIFIMDAEAPVVQFDGPGAGYLQGEIDVRCQLRNAGAAPLALRGTLQIESDAAPRQAEQQVALPPGESRDFRLAYADTPHTARHLDLQVRDSGSGGKVYRRRQFSWEPAAGSGWMDPSESKAAEIDFAFYPYQRRLKARIEHAGPVRFSVKDGGGAPIGQPVTGAAGAAEWELPQLAPGDYTLEGDTGNARFQRTFTVQNFTWEHNTIGDGAVIVPPFRPLQVEGRQVSALLTAYRVRDGFWDEIMAQGENILAAPVQLLVNGEVAREHQVALPAAGGAQAEVRSELRLPGLRIDSRHEYDYDGMCKVTLRFAPDGELPVRHAAVEIPLRNGAAPLFHAVGNVMKRNPVGFLPAGEGVVWHTLMAPEGRLGRINFRPYVWLGGIYRGLSWFAESDRGLSLDAEKPAMEIVRSGETLLLRVHLVTAPTVWQAPFELVMGFQATPVKPQPEGWRRMSSRRPAPNAIPFATLAGPAIWGSGFLHTAPYPAGHDYSMVEQLAAANRRTAHARRDDVEAFVLRHFSAHTLEQQNFVRRHLERGRNWGKFCTWLVPYLNARTLHKEWESYPVYQDEWWCSDYRANSHDEYNVTPTRSYQDMMVYYARELVRHGLDGLYYDNIRDWPVSDTSTGPAWRRADGSVQPYFDIFSMRALLKRSAVMLHQEGKGFLDGRPLLIAHMTNTNLIPFLSFAGMSLDLEAFFGSTDFQERFSEGWLLATATGTQNGCVPQILVSNTGEQTDWLTRTFLAVTLPADLPLVMVAGGITDTFYRSWDRLREFGYGSDQVESFPWWSEPPVRSPLETLRLAVHRHRGRAASVVCLGSRAEADLAAELDLSGLGYGRCRVVDMESGQELPCHGSMLPVTVPRHDFRMLMIQGD